MGIGRPVDYGPDPAETIEFVRFHALTVIRGNHDNAVGFGTDCGCSPRFTAMAEATRKYTTSVSSASDKQFLRDLPTCACRQRTRLSIFSRHATPVGFRNDTVCETLLCGPEMRSPVQERTFCWRAIRTCRSYASSASAS